MRTCRVCGCTDQQPCLDENGQPCYWVASGRPIRTNSGDGSLCSECSIFASALHSSFDTGFEQPGSDEPLVELATDAECDRLIAEFRKGARA